MPSIHEEVTMKLTGSLIACLALVVALIPAGLRAESERGIEVARMVLCGGIEGREPYNPSEDFTPDVNRVYCFTEIRNAGSPRTITHRWYFEGRLMAEVPLDVEGERFRTWSSKQVTPGTAGEWRVEVVDEAGEPLGDITFRVTALE
jgi:hypothetical protein